MEFSEENKAINIDGQTSAFPMIQVVSGREEDFIRIEQLSVNENISKITISRKSLIHIIRMTTKKKKTSAG